MVRTRGGQISLYGECAHRLFVCVSPWYMISRCTAYADRTSREVRGVFGIESIRPWKRWGIFDATDRAYLSIISSGEQQEGGEATPCVNPGWVRGGVRRPRAASEFLGAPSGGIYVDDAKISEELKMLAIDIGKRL